MHAALLILCALPGGSDASGVSQRIDELIAAHWKDNDVEPAPRAADAAFLRRLSLDLIGRPPTVAEMKQFLADAAPDRRSRAIERMMQGPEYPLHFGRVLDDILQDERAGNGEFLEYLRNSLAARKSWDRIFREVMVGPWDDKELKGAQQFIAMRVKEIDDLTTDTARSFFGVNVSCAKCHDHPLVMDWKQDHYYGMSSFFARTQANKGGVNPKDKSKGEVMFTTTKGDRRTAKLMYLSGEVIEEERAKKTSTLRELLVESALEERKFFSRAIVNRMWAYFFGRGLVHPVDQMHSANAPMVPDLLEALGEDFAANGYNLDRLVAGIVSSEAYQLAGFRDSGSEPPAPHLFAQAQVRALTPHQFAMSLHLVLGEEGYDEATKPEDREKRWRELEGRAGRLVGSKVLDGRGERYQASASEALYISNHPEVQALVRPSGKNLATRLAGMNDPRAIVETAITTVLSRPARPDEVDYLTNWFTDRKADKNKACSQLLWALATSAEFRFNH